MPDDSVSFYPVYGLISPHSPVCGGGWLLRIPESLRIRRVTEEVQNLEILGSRPAGIAGGFPGVRPRVNRRRARVAFVVRETFERRVKGWVAIVVKSDR